MLGVGTSSVLANKVLTTNSTLQQMFLNGFIPAGNNEGQKMTTANVLRVCIIRDVRAPTPYIVRLVE